MLTRIIDFSLGNRAVVMLFVALAAAAGIYSVSKLDIDAFPDTTPIQVQINTIAPSLGPEEVETLITAPIEQMLGGLPKLSAMRSTSKFGLSQVVVLFEDGTDIYFARMVVTERLNAVQLPQNLDRPKLGPVSTGLGEVFHYVITGAVSDKTELRTMHDWVIRPQMKKVAGTAEVNSWGGFEKQYQVRVDPQMLLKHQLTMEEVTRALTENNRNAGGGTLTSGGQQLIVKGIGRIKTIPEIEAIVISSQKGVPIRVRDIGVVEVGHEVRRGAVTFDGKGEAVLGLGFSTMGENTHTITWDMKRKLAEVQESLPRNVVILPVYDRTELVEHVIQTVRNNLFEGGLLVIAVLFAFLGNLRAAAIVALAIPLSMLFAFMGMYKFGISASLLSLGAIDFGLVVDSSVVMIENCVRKMAHNTEGKTREEVIRDAAIEVRKPTLFGELIIMIVYLPILTLEGTEGKMFRPMALTVLFALMGSMILSMTLMPVLSSMFLPKKVVETEPLLMKIAHFIYRPLLKLAMRYRWAVIGFALCTLIFAFGFVKKSIGTDYMPKLSEGAIAVGIIRPVGTDLAESIRSNSSIERAIMQEFPNEVQHVWSRIGTGDVATDPMGVEQTDMYIVLFPRSKWTKATTQDELSELLEKRVRSFPGISAEFSQPIQMRINEMDTGIRSEVGILLYGDDLDLLRKKAEEVEKVMKDIPGVADLRTEATAGLAVMQIKVKPDELARYGVSAQQVMEFVESIGTRTVGEVYEGQIRFPLVVRLPDRYRSHTEMLEQMVIPTTKGERVPLNRLARVEVVEGPSTITREWGQRRIVVSCNVRGRDLGSFVEEAQKKVADSVKMPAGRYHLEWGGQYEKKIRAEQRLMLVVPLAFVLILGLLYATYQSWGDALRVFTAVPFAWVGGLIALWLRDMPLSVSAAVGFVALSGVAVLDDMILVTTVRRLRSGGMALQEAVETAAMMRLRPVLMTTLVAGLGFVPMAFSTGIGAEVQRPLATVVIGGVVGSFVMSLLVLRVLYMMLSRKKWVNTPGSNKEG